MTTFAADASAAADQAEDLSMERETLRKKERGIASLLMLNLPRGNTLQCVQVLSHR